MPQPEPSSDVSWRGRGEGRVRTGMTLMELLIVVSLIGITMAFAIPSYQRMRERRYYGEAQNILHAIYSGERAYFFQKGDYLDSPADANDWKAIRMEDPNELLRFPVTFSINCSGGCSLFTATADRDAGPCGGSTITINEKREMKRGVTPIELTSCWCGAC